MFGHDEQRNAFGAGDGFAVRAWNFGQHQVDDVLGQLVVTGGNPHLVALEAVAWPQGVAGMLVTVGRGAGSDIGQGRPSLRFAQTHGAGKAAVEFVQRKDLFLHIRAVLHEQIGVAHRQHGDPNADRGACEKRIGRRLYGVGQLHAANVVVLGRAQHAALHIGVERLLGTGGQDDFFAIKTRFLHIDGAIVRCVFVAGDALAGVQDRVKSFTGMVGKPASCCQAINHQPVIQQKINSVSEGHGLTLKDKTRHAGRVGSVVSGARLKALQRCPPHPCPRQCTWSRTRAWHLDACLRSGRDRSSVGRSRHRGGPPQWRRH